MTPTETVRKQREVLDQPLGGNGRPKKISVSAGTRMLDLVLGCCDLYYDYCLLRETCWKCHYKISERTPLDRTQCRVEPTRIYNNEDTWIPQVSLPKLAKLSVYAME